MDAVKYFKEKARMSQNCYIGCDNCLLGVASDLSDVACVDFEQLKPDEAVKIVEEWAKAHPQKTRKQDFFEKYPNAPKDDKGYPKNTCCKELGYCMKCVYVAGSGCYDCWDEPPVEE